MTRNKSRSFLGGLFLAMAAASLIALPAAASWSLVWSDEFDGSSLDPANWTPDIGDGCPNLCGWGNNELEYYRSENIQVTGGNLVLTAKEEYYGGRAFTSGKVTTRNKQSFLYGRIEMRAKLPYGNGMWPAFWMMPQDDVYGGWAASGEIDIMESANDMSSIGGTLHFGGTYPENTSTGGSYSPGGANFSDDFHVYAIEWEPDVMRWYVDGNLYSTKYSSQWYSASAPANPRAPFDQEFYIILNAAVGGWYTGCTSSGCVTDDLPQQFVIDYVRVYEDIDNFPPTVAITSPAPGAAIPAGDIVIEAAAEDSDGTVVKVEFYRNDTYLGEDTASPYSFTWASAPDGCYEIVAKATDDLGATGTDMIDITVGAGCGQESYLGYPHAIPTRIQAEDFDVGGAGVAYKDADVGNNGAQYRTSEDVDIEICYDAGGGYGVGWLEEGEWLEYTVNVPVGGEYPIDIRVASLMTGGVFHLEFDGVDRTGEVTVPVTTGWQNWETVSTTAVLASGEHVMRFVPETDGFNVNWFEFPAAPTAVAPGLPARGYALHPCYPNPFNPSTTIGYDLPEPATVELAVYDVAGKLVRTLVSGAAVEAGRHEVVWNGRDGTGRIAAAGVYFCRLEAGGYAETRRMMLVK